MTIGMLVGLPQVENFCNGPAVEVCRGHASENANKTRLLKGLSLTS